MIAVALAAVATAHGTKDTIGKKSIDTAKSADLYRVNKKPHVWKITRWFWLAINEG